MTNPMPLVAVATDYYVNYIDLFIYIRTQSLLKSLDKKALHIEYAECIYYLGECVQKCTPRLSQVVLGII
jgi:hypothetical protein